MSMEQRHLRPVNEEYFQELQAEHEASVSAARAPLKIDSRKTEPQPLMPRFSATTQTRRRKVVLSLTAGLGIVGMGIASSVLSSGGEGRQASRQEVVIKTTPVTLVNGLELFHFINDTSDDPNVRNRSGLYPLTQSQKENLIEAGYDSNNAQIAEGEENIGPLRHPQPGQDVSTGTEPYVVVQGPDGTRYHTPKSNIKPS